MIIYLVCLLIRFRVSLIELFLFIKINSNVI